MNNDTEQLVLKLRDIPPLSEMQTLLQAVSNQDVDFQELAKIIESSPPTAARIIKVANSAFYGTTAQVDSVKDAIIRVLGLDVVRSLVMGLAASSAFNAERCPAFDTHRYWCSALLTANLARRLAGIVTLDDAPVPDFAYLGGLLHNIGLIALAHIAPTQMSEVFAAAERNQRPLHEVESQVLGLDHRQAGALIVAQWGMPEQLHTVIVHYHEDGYRGPEWVACRLVRLCSDWAQQALRGAAPGIDGDSVAELQMDTRDLNAVIGTAHQEVQSIIDLAQLFH